MASTSTAALYTADVGEALRYAADVHATQRRKGKDEFYLSHLLQVAALVIRYGGSQAQIIAGVLHDAPEDHGGEARLEDIEARFGPEAASIVRACSDSLTDDPEAKAPWRDRKEQHLRHYQHHLGPAVALVAAADKIANLTDIVDDMQQETRDPAQSLTKFNGGIDGTRAYYAAMLALLQEHLPLRAADHLARLVAELGAAPVPEGADPVEDFLARTRNLDSSHGRSQ